MKRLEKAEMKWHRQRLKEARRAGLSDLENAHQLVVAIELLGKALHDNRHDNQTATFGQVECCLIAFATRWDPDGETEDPNASPLGVILERVREQRNDYAHEGTAARRLARQAAEAAIRLERALLKAETEESPMEMRDVMISPVICAEEWQTLAHIRRIMLLHEFTILPYREKGECADGQWKFIEAEHVVKALFKDGNGVLGMTVKAAVDDKILMWKCAKTAKACDQVHLCSPATTLVVTDTGDAAGLVTPFDLL